MSKDKLLEKCLHGKTKDANEALQRCSKITFSGRKLLEITVTSAVFMLNDGAESIANVTRKTGLNGRTHTDIELAQREKKYKRRSTGKQSENSKKRRKQLNAHKNGWVDKNFNVGSISTYICDD